MAHTWKFSLPAAGSGGSHAHLGEMLLRLCGLGTQPFVFCALHRLQNETAANEVLASIQNYFKSQPFDFRGAQIISGQEEGIYGWITANYLMGNFLEVCEKCMVFILAICPFPCGWQLQQRCSQQGHLSLCHPCCVMHSRNTWETIAKKRHRQLVQNLGP